MIKQELTKDEIEFLSESNKIERESGEIGSVAMDDAVKAWIYAKREFKKNKGKLSIPFILGIHKRLLQRLALHYAGQIRTGAVMIGGEVRSQSKDEIIEEWGKLIEEWNNRIFLTGNSSQTEKREKQIKEYFVKTWHIGWEQVHGNFDGNGRTGRILMNLQRLELELPLLIIHCGKEQSSYYQWFKGDKK